MEHQEHLSLIRDLDNKVRPGPQTDHFRAAYFQGCWALIQRIGPSFRETPYPNRRERDQSFARFQTLVGHVKEQQAAWERESTAMADDFEARLKALSGQPAGMAELESAGETAEPDFNELRRRSDECKTILDTFLAARPLLSPGDYRRVSERLRSTRQGIQKGFDARRDERAEAGEKSPLSPEQWREKQTRFRKKLQGIVRRDEDCLAREKDVLTGLRKEMASEKEPVRLGRLRGLAENTEKNLAMLGEELTRTRSVLSKVEAQLAGS